MGNPSVGENWVICIRTKMNDRNSSLNTKPPILSTKKIGISGRFRCVCCLALNIYWSRRWQLHACCRKCNRSAKKCATWNEKEESKDVLYPSVCGHKGVWEDCWLGGGECDVEYTCTVLWWWHISEESKVAVPTQVLWESRHEEQWKDVWLHF